MVNQYQMKAYKLGKRFLILLLLSAILLTSNGVTTAVADGAKASIPLDAASYAGHSYKIYTSPLSWTAAYQACRNLGGHLVTINSSAEQSFIEQLMSSTSNGVLRYWIGLTDQNKEGDWSHWITGEAVTYKKWNYSNPDDLNGQDYACIAAKVWRASSGWRINLGEWDDEANVNDYVGGYICEWENLTTLPSIATDTVTDIAPSSAKVYFNINSCGGSAITEAGIQHGYTKTSVKNKSCGATGEQTGTFSVMLTGLRNNKKVYYRAYAKNIKGTVYGSWNYFKTTTVSAPTVETLSAANVGSKQAKFRIRISKNGGANVTDCGIIWGYAKNSMKKKISFGGVNAQKGEFSRIYKNLPAETTIYYKAYATNKIGTTYGKVMSLKTLAVTQFNVSHPALNGTNLEMSEKAGVGAVSNLTIQSNNAWKVTLTNNTPGFLEIVDAGSGSAKVTSKTTAQGAAGKKLTLRLKIKTLPAGGTTSKATLTFTVGEQRIVYTVTLKNPVVTDYITGLSGKVMSASEASSMIVWKHVNIWNSAGKIRYIQQYFPAGGTYYRSSYWYADKVRHNCDYAAAYMAVSYLGKDALPKTKLTRTNNNVMNAVAKKEKLGVASFNTAADFINSYHLYSSNGNYSPIMVYTRWTNGGTGYHAWIVFGRVEGEDDYFWILDPGYNNPLMKARFKVKNGTLRVADVYSCVSGKWKRFNVYDENTSTATYYQYAAQ